MTNEQQNQPVFSLQKFYVKDISFENPNSPEVLLTSGQQKVEMKLDLSNRQVDEKHWEVTLKVSALVRNSESDQLMFEVEVEHAGLFYMDNIPEEHFEVLLGVDCPTAIFPFTRQIISQLTIDGGFMPLLLEPVNFAAAFQNNRQQAAQTETIN